MRAILSVVSELTLPEPDTPDWALAVARELVRRFHNGQRLLLVTLDPVSPAVSSVGRREPVDTEHKSGVNSINR